jgi:hypothetical protein
MHATSLVIKSGQVKTLEKNKEILASPFGKKSGITAGDIFAKKAFLKFLLCVGFCLFLLSAAAGQSTQYTKNSPDQTLRSNGRVNPSSLGMEMNIPLSEYAGRGISLPLGLSYSSKLWRFQENRIEYLNNGNQNIYAYARYSEDAASGWTSSLSQAYIEYTGELNRFDNQGRPLPDEVFGPGAPSPIGDNYIRRIRVFLPGGGSHELRAGRSYPRLYPGQSSACQRLGGSFLCDGRLRAEIRPEQYGCAGYLPALYAGRLLL